MCQHHLGLNVLHSDGVLTVAFTVRVALNAKLDEVIYPDGLTVTVAAPVLDAPVDGICHLVS